jgi:hypothetical protein
VLIPLEPDFLQFLVIIVGALRKKLAFSDPPPDFGAQGIPAILAGIMALAFIGFDGIVNDGSRTVKDLYDHDKFQEIFREAPAFTYVPALSSAEGPNTGFIQFSPEISLSMPSVPAQKDLESMLSYAVEREAQQKSAHTKSGVGCYECPHAPSRRPSKKPGRSIPLPSMKTSNGYTSSYGHHEGRRARHGAAMMGADYTQWHGFYEVAQSRAQGARI